MDKIVPLDIWSIKTFGVDLWYEGFNQLPVSEFEKYAIYIDLYDKYVELVLTSSGRDRDVLVILYKLIMEYHMVLYSFLSKQRLEKKQVGYMVDPNHRTFISHYLNKDVRNSFLNIEEALSSSLGQSVKDICLQSARRIKYNHNDSVFSRSLKDGDFLAFKYPKAILIKYAKSCDKKISLLAPWNFVEKYRSFANIGIAKELTDVFLWVADKHRINIPSNINNLINKVTLNSINNAYPMLIGFEKYLSKLPSTKLLVPAFGKTIDRAMCFGAKNSGHEVIGSTHGGNVGFYSHADWFNIDIICSDKYMVPTKNSVTAMEKYNKSYKLSTCFNTRFFSFEEAQYANQFDILKQSEINRVNKTVMC